VPGRAVAAGVLSLAGRSLNWQAHSHSPLSLKNVRRRCVQRVRWKSFDSNSP
jgi:hypothetical protein